MNMNKKRSTFRLTVSHFKILETVKELNDQHDYPTAKGINNILMGKPDPETKQYINIKTFGTLISFPGRKLCSYILNMVRRGYLTYVYDEHSDGMYLRLTEKGEMELFSFNKRHKQEFKKKIPHHKCEIVHLD